MVNIAMLTIWSTYCPRGGGGGRVDVCSTQPLCRGIQSAFRRVTHQRPRRRRRRRVYFGPFRNNPENNGVDQIVTRPFAVPVTRDTMPPACTV